MDYPRNDELLSAYLDRELSPDERAAMDRMLERSPEARERLRELEVTSRFVRRLPQHGSETDFADAVIDRLRNESLLRPAPVEPARSPRRLSWRISAPLALAATLLLAVWMTKTTARRSEPTAVPIAGIEADLGTIADASLGRWGQLQVGDFFELVGPEGENPFQLIVVGKEPDEDAVRCVLVDKSEKRDATLQPGSEGPQSDAAPASDVSTLALQADREQLDALLRAYAQANSSADESFPVVDIIASKEPDGLIVGNVKTHSRFAPTPARSMPAPNEDVPASAPGVDRLSASRAARAAQDPAKATGSDLEARRLPASPTEPEDRQSVKDETQGLASNAGAASQSERGQLTFKIDKVVQLDGGLPAQRGSAPETAEELSARKKVSESVRDLAKADEPRIGVARPDKNKQPRGRVQVILNLRDSSDSEKSHQ
jgi:hypothetical protein